MKVEREESEFKPIVITIENEDEAHTLWHWLNMDYEQTGRQYANEVEIPERDPQTITRLFWALDRALGDKAPF